MAVPVLFGGTLLIALLSLVGLSRFDGCVRGALTEMEFESTCSEDAAIVVMHRLELMGLPNREVISVEDTLTVRATFPGYTETEHETIPQMLSAIGQLELRAADTVLFSRSDVTLSELDQDESGMPVVVLTLSDEAADRVRTQIAAEPNGTTQFYLDDNLMVDRTNQRQLEGNTIRVLVMDGDTRSRMQRMADLNIMMNTDPLPCSISVQSVQAVE